MTPSPTAVPCHHSSERERRPKKGRYCKHSSRKRGSAGVRTLPPRDPVNPERTPSPKPSRDEDAPLETAEAAPHRTGPRPSDCGSSGPPRRHERLRLVSLHRSDEMSPTGERESPNRNGFVQQIRPPLPTGISTNAGAWLCGIRLERPDPTALSSDSGRTTRLKMTQRAVTRARKVLATLYRRSESLDCAAFRRSNQCRGGKPPEYRTGLASSLIRSGAWLDMADEFNRLVTITAIEGSWFPYVQENSGRKIERFAAGRDIGAHEGRSLCLNGATRVLTTRPPFCHKR